MAGTLNDLYLKYCGRVQTVLENDRYYEYLLGLISSGKTVITQNNRVINKEVDEKWLSAVEDAIPSLHEIIAHPKRFIKTEENLVPVELAKKVTPESVRHLSQHTQNITGIKGGMIIPGKILSVENQESLDLYENRFINTLIRKLYSFIEKRTDILFWETGNEHTSALQMESVVDDDYEEIDYKLEIVVKNKQTYVENDRDKMEIFKRIDRVHRMIGDFRRSSFVQLMQDTTPVHSPVQRTNQIIKNNDYKKCYDLWQFLERYDQLGYEITVHENAIDFDEDYLFQMYGNIAMSYTVFKTLLEADPRKLNPETKKKKVVKPKFIKQIVEEFVDNYDLPDVEIRRVIVEEVTKAQLEIERRQAELLAKAKERDAEQKKTAAAKEREKVKAQKAKEAALEKQRLAKEKEQERVRLQREKAAVIAKERAAREKQAAHIRALKAKEDAREKARIAKEKEREKQKLLKEKALAAEKARLAKEAEQAKQAALKAKAAEKARLDKEKERAKQAALKAKAAEKARLDKEKERAKQAALKEKAAEKARLDKEKATEKPVPPKKPAPPKKTVPPKETAPKKAVTEETVPEEVASAAGADVASEVADSLARAVVEVLDAEEATPEKTVPAEAVFAETVSEEATPAEAVPAEAIPVGIISEGAVTVEAAPTAEPDGWLERLRRRVRKNKE